jgi:hypothetical protein
MSFMKKLFFVLIVSLSAISSAFSQKTNLIFFSENGERFTIILNGIKQNAQPETNIKVTDLPAPSYKVKVIFADSKLGEVNKNLLFGQGTETTFVIKKNNKGEYIIRYMNEVPLSQAAPAAPEQTVVYYNTNSEPEENEPINGNTTTVIHTKTTTTSSQGGGDNGAGNVSVGMNINDPDLGININMNVSGPGTTTTTSGSSSSYTTTTTTTTTSSSSSDGEEYEQHERPRSQPKYVLPGYSGPTGCPMPLSSKEFSDVKASISSKTFDDTKLTIAKQVIGSNCLLCSQVKEIMLLFTFEDTRLELAKYGYGYTYDIGNYYKLNDAFTFEASIEELNTFINSQKR